MKELSIEEKVKAYDELLIKAKQIHNKENDVLILHTIEDLFPELKESEDERIRKRIIALVNAHGQGMYKDEVLAWLEKQGEQKPTIEMKSAEESLGIDSETYNKIVDECIYSEQKLAELPKVKSVPMSFMEKLGIFMQYTSVDLEKEENKQLLKSRKRDIQYRKAFRKA